MTILVTAAHGNQGKLLLPKLKKLGAKVRALRGNGPITELVALGATEGMAGDAADPQVQAKALAGIKTVYYVGPAAHPRERDMGLSMVDAAVKAGVEHFIFSSVLHPIIDAMSHHALKRDIEERLIASGLHFTILQPADYMQVISFRGTFETGTYARWWSIDRREEMVDLEDVTDVAVRVIKEGRAHFGATYQLCSGEAPNGYQIAETISRVMGREVEAIETSAEDFLRKFFGLNPDDPKFAYPLKVLQDLNKWYGAHDFIGNANVLGMLLARKPTSFEKMLRREWAAYQAAKA